MQRGTRPSFQPRIAWAEESGLGADVTEALGGVAKRLLYDNMKTVVLERDVDGPGEHRYHAGFLDYAKHCGFVIKLCRPYRARTKECAAYCTSCGMCGETSLAGG